MSEGSIGWNSSDAPSICTSTSFNIPASSLTSCSSSSFSTSLSSALSPSSSSCSPSILAATSSLHSFITSTTTTTPSTPPSSCSSKKKSSPLSQLSSWTPTQTTSQLNATSQREKRQQEAAVKRVLLLESKAKKKEADAANPLKLKPKTREQQAREALEHDRLMREIPQTKEYRPTAEEFADAMSYIRSIAEDAKKYGIVKIVPPKGWEPPYDYTFPEQNVGREEERREKVEEKENGGKMEDVEMKTGLLTAITSPTSTSSSASPSSSSSSSSSPPPLSCRIQRVSLYHDPISLDNWRSPSSSSLLNRSRISLDPIAAQISQVQPTKMFLGEFERRAKIQEVMWAKRYCKWKEMETNSEEKKEKEKEKESLQESKECSSSLSFTIINSSTEPLVIPSTSTSTSTEDSTASASSQPDFDETNDEFDSSTTTADAEALIADLNLSDPLAAEQQYWRWLWFSTRTSATTRYANDIDAHESFRQPRNAAQNQQQHPSSSSSGTSSPSLPTQSSSLRTPPLSPSLPCHSPSPSLSPSPSSSSPSSPPSHPWDLSRFARLSNGVLRYLPAGIPGVTDPMLYIGMLFSTFSWHVEDNFLYSISYNHKGATKTWYGVPGEYYQKVEAVARKLYPSLPIPQADSLLAMKTSMFSPIMLSSSSIPIYRALQTPNSFIITFPKAYHSGFSHGFSLAESVNFALDDWMKEGAMATMLYRQINKPSVVPMEELIMRMTEDVLEEEMEIEMDEGRGKGEEGEGERGRERERKKGMRENANDLVLLQRLEQALIALVVEEDQLRQKQSTRIRAYTSSSTSSSSTSFRSFSSSSSSPSLFVSPRQRRDPFRRTFLCRLCRHACYLTYIKYEDERGITCLRHSIRKNSSSSSASSSSSKTRKSSSISSPSTSASLPTPLHALFVQQYWTHELYQYIQGLHFRCQALAERTGETIKPLTNQVAAMIKKGVSEEVMMEEERMEVDEVDYAIGGGGGNAMTRGMNGIVEDSTPPENQLEQEATFHLDSNSKLNGKNDDRNRNDRNSSSSSRSKSKLNSSFAEAESNSSTRTRIRGRNGSQAEPLTIQLVNSDGSSNGSSISSNRRSKRIRK